jgi:hypothetical protein
LNWVSGSTYRLGTPSTNSSTTIVANRTYYTPIFIPSAMSIDRISCLTGSSFSGTAIIRLGIYADAAGLPSTLILDAGTVSATAAATGYTITISATIPTGGIYWLALNTQTAAATNTVASAASQIMNGLPSIGTTTSIYSGYSESSITGAFVDVVSPALSATTGPLVFLRRV